MESFSAGDAPIQGAAEARTIFADAALVIDRGETIHVLLCRDRPGPDGETIRAGERWIVFPRAGFLASLFAAVDQFLPGSAPASAGRRVPPLN